MYKALGLVFACVMMLSIFACLAVAGCSSIETGRTVLPVRLLLANTMELPFKADKCLLDQATDTYYIMEQGRPNIHFYRAGKEINTIGGFGTENSNFQKLADIALDPEGNLLALDIFAKLIRKYTPDGKWIADINLNGFNQPANLCSTPENDFVIYDSATQELSKVSGFDGKVSFAFGRFQLETVSHLTATRDYIAVVNANADRTVLFTSLGQFVDEYPYQMVLDRFQNRFRYEQGAIRHDVDEVFIPLGWNNDEVRLMAAPQALLLIRNNTVLTILPAYQGN